MKKSSLHFKIAAWSIKHPGKTYAAMAACTMFLLLLCFVATSMVLKSQMPTVSPLIANVSARGSSDSAAFEKVGWTITSQQMVSGRQCVSYKKASNGTRITSCYVQDGKNWIFQQSF